MKHVTLLVVLATSTLACNAAPPGATGAPGASTIANTDWVLGTIADTPIPSGTAVTLLFTFTKAAGFGGCNQYSASYTSNGSSTLTFGPIAATRMACAGGGDVFEAAYYAALARVRTYKIEGTTLTLSGEGGAVLLTFGAAAQATVEGPWTVTLVNNGTGAVSSVPAGISAAMSFLPDGTIEGFGGCNSFSGSYEVDGDTIAIGPLMSTRMACAEDVNTFESQLVTALQNATSWSVSGGTLDLRDADGSQQVEAVSAIGH
jgi:heat shock protein HslJ